MLQAVVGDSVSPYTCDGLWLTKMFYQFRFAKRKPYSATIWPRQFKGARYAVLITVPCVELYKLIGNKVKLDPIILILFGGTTDKSGCRIWSHVLLGSDLNPRRNKVAGNGVASRESTALPMNSEEAIGRDGSSVCAFDANAKVRCGRPLALADPDELNPARIFSMNPLDLTQTAADDCQSAKA